MLRTLRLAVPLAVLSLALAVAGCASISQLALLRTAAFAFAGVSDVRLVGIPIGPGADYSKLGVADAARVAAAIVTKQAPLDLVAHVTATNPAENRATAKMLGLGWKFYVEDHMAFSGNVADPIELPAGKPVDVPLTVRFDLVQLGAGGARDLFDLAVAIAGQGQIKKDLRLELVPVIDTPAGRMAFPAPIVVHRLAAN